jgi:hypothetical protein
MSQTLPTFLSVADAGDHVRTAYTGDFSMPRSMECIDHMLGACRTHGRVAALLDCRGMTGPLTVADRYDTVRHAVKMTGIAVAIIGRPAHVSGAPGFMELIGANRGINVKVFIDEGEALAWLRVQSNGRNGDGQGAYGRRHVTTG